MSLTAEQWRSVATDKLLELLAVEGAVTQPEMEAKLSEGAFGSSGRRHRPQPHHLSTARHRLLDANVIVQQRNTTRGGRTVSTFSLADVTKKADRAAARKRLLHARYLSPDPPIGGRVWRVEANECPCGRENWTCEGSIQTVPRGHPSGASIA